MALEAAIAALGGGDNKRPPPEQVQTPANDGPLSGAIAALSSPTPAAEPKQAAQAPKADLLQVPKDLGGPGYAEAALNAASGIGAGIIGGWRGLATLATGGSVDEAAKAVEQEMQDRTYQPVTPVGQKATALLASPVNPMNWPAMLGKKAGDATLEATDSPGAATAVESALTAAPLLLLRGGKAPSMTKAPNPSVAEALRPQVTEAPPQTLPPVTPELPAYIRKAEGTPPAQVAAAEPAQAANSVFVDEGPKVGGFPLPVQDSRAQVLSRIGLDKARQSAISGDVLNGASDFQTTKFNEPAGEAAKAQFAAERNALTNHAESIVRDTGGSLGMDEESLQTRGQTVAKPFDDLRTWFEEAKRGLYAEANKRAEGAPLVVPENINKLMADPDFEQTLIAKGQSPLYGAIQTQFKRFAELNPEGVTVANAEKFRKWLNTTWTPENSATLGRVKAALDEDVFKSAGADVYAQGRQMHILEKQTLDNPKGAAKLLDFDPQTPINRTTAFNKIPDTLTRLSPDQFGHILDTLKNMPAELKPQADAALAEIKAHVANKLLDVGNKHQTQWNAPGVTKYLNDNSAKLKMLFGDDPAMMGKISDLQQAGNILRVEGSYPGAAAQASNAMKRGTASNLIRPAGAVIGETIGSAFGIPGIGTAAGDLAGGRVAGGIGERAALKNWQKRVIPLSEVGK